MNIDALKKELKSFSKQKLIEEYKDLYLAHDMLKQTSIALNKQLDQANKRLKEIDNFKYNYGYTNYEDSYMLEDLQSRAFQREDDTAVVESLFDFFDICDENEILPKVEEISEKLKCAIVPKFKIGQEVYKVYTKDQRFPFKVKIIGVKITQTEEKISVLCDTEEDGIEMGWYPEKILFETLEEAEKKLQELRGGE